MSDEKTEKPTEKKLQDARRDGEVPISPDVTAAAVLLAALLVMKLAGSYFVEHLRALMSIGFDFTANTRDATALHRALGRIGIQGVLLTLPFVTACLAAGLIGTFVQTGLNASLKPVTPKFDSLNPVNGVKKLFSLRSLINLLKLGIKAAVIGVVLWYGLRALMPTIISLAYQPTADIAQIGWRALGILCALAVLVFVLVGAADWSVQHWLFIRDKRMSKDEQKREHKDSEGDPELKGKRKEFAKELVFGDPRERVAKAKVMVVNPTHYAVALAYEPDGFGLPQVVAKGVDEGALELRAYAHTQGIPIVANPPLARALHEVELGEAVPESLFETVAVVLRWVDELGRDNDEGSGPLPC
ncbi:type III secretion system export apparatus subunit SctU [Xanthomonas campestris pv. campestris]|uniref:type III secretion system export apparatus subunit SctU n=1 Tax=Xanthomonas campestris TaxID=339 RepID=UPI0023782674|nr:type III secretion system export apparatus subunit SctU [Xanthomonas campestris]WDK57032.1 type III secretion system export apparatus subunit SctU [Xanthomonas campestris pv. campestris]WDK64057.1 type III secretion system export apparatus subunit SctU [Xanthomonas campestris pv. campestris]WDK71978.1 type III secretion system export apparatus subunit SctU [Xanthomonas campestris pv. campestris]WDK76178.1 type III secretion system export apparatus subunit SctU [Xanthomonas campestris pv. cam